MCTVLLAFRMIEGWPLLVANNRDEFFQRQALPPRVYSSGKGDGRRWLASCDLSGGGSWWGYNNRGLMVCLTNRWVENEYEEGCRSRGQLVLDLLAYDDLGGARVGLAELCTEAAYNPFNLIVASREKGFFASNYAKLHYSHLLPGYHFLGNSLLDICTSVKARSARRLFAELSEPGFFGPVSGKEKLTLTLAHFRKALRTPFPQDDIPPQGFNVRFDGYGTTSSWSLAVSERGSENLILDYCNANPLYENFQDYSGLTHLL